MSKIIKVRHHTKNNLAFGVPKDLEDQVTSEYYRCNVDRYGNIHFEPVE